MVTKIKRITTSGMLCIALSLLMIQSAGAVTVFEAAKEGNVAVLTSLLNADSNLVNARERDTSAPDVVAKNWTPLHWAAYKGQARAADYLISKGADINARDDFGYLPLHHASNKATVDALIDRHADVNARSRSNRWTPLHRAAFIENAEVVNALLARGGDANARDRIGKTPLHYAAGWSKDTAVAEALIRGGARLNARDNAGWQPLHNAAYAGLVDIVKLLMEKGADPNARDDFGKTPLTHAQAAGKTEVVELLQKATN